MKDNELVEQFRDYIQIPSITPSGNEVKAIKYIENILKGASIDYSIEAREEEHPNLIAKLTATRLMKEKPIILISHSDVVPVNEEAWTFPPFSATVSKNRIYGRGTLDTKQLTMMQLYSFLEIAKHKELLNRDVYLCVTANEEGGSFYGMEYMKEIHKDYFEEAIVINEGGGFPIITEEDYYLTMTIGEKGRAEVELIASGLGSHASAPSKDQAILKLMKQLSTLIEGIEALKGADKSPLEILKSKLSSKSLFIDRMLAYHENHDIKIKKNYLDKEGILYLQKFL